MHVTSPTYEELQTRIDYLTEENTVLARLRVSDRIEHDHLLDKLAASEESVRELHEAIAGREKAI